MQPFMMKFTFLSPLLTRIAVSIHLDSGRLPLSEEADRFFFVSRNLFDKLVKGFKDNYPADTIQESVVKYVRDLGFTDGDIAKFRAIMLAER